MEWLFAKFNFYSQKSRLMYINVQTLEFDHSIVFYLNSHPVDILISDC